MRKFGKWLIAMVLYAATAGLVSAQGVDFSRYDYDDRKGLRDAVNSELRILSEGVEGLYEATRDPDLIRKPGTREVMTEVQTKKVGAENALEVLKDAETQDEWEEAKGTMEEALEEYRGAYQDALDHVQDEEVFR
jgi:hypothetical protein